MQALRERAHARRRRRFVDEVEAGLAGLRDQRADALMTRSVLGSS